MVTMSVIGSGEASTHDEPSLEDVRSAVVALDSLSGIAVVSDSAWLGVSGGPSWFAVSYALEADGPIWQARGPAEAPASLDFVAGGQPTGMGNPYLVDVDAAIEAAQHFVSTGEMLTTMVWDEM